MSPSRTAATETTTTVRVLDPSEADDAARLLAAGFAEEPGNLALFPDAAVRHAVLEAGSRTYVRDGLRYGTAHVAVVGDELAGIALWHPPGVGGFSLVEVARSVRGLLPAVPRVARTAPHLASVVVGEAREAVTLPRARARAVASASRGTTWHLAFLATAPEHRGRGHARGLLERQLRRCDEDGLAVWLETTDPVNPPIYERFGFGTVAHIEDAAWLPGLWVMRREPSP